MGGDREWRETLSVVVPAYNEEGVLREFHSRLARVLGELAIDAEIVFVNDGSTDETGSVLADLRRTDPRITVVDLSRNFGKEIALSAGLDFAVGDAVVVIDADLQDPPEVIPRLLEQWRLGYEVVYARRGHREGDTFLKRTTARWFYRLMQQIGGSVVIPVDTGDFRLLSRRAVLAVRDCREHHRFMKGLFSWVGFRQTAVLYDRDPRFAGQTKWGYLRLWNLALEGVTSFTIAPLKVSTYLGVLSALGAFVYGSEIIIRTLLFGNPVPGYPSLMVVLLFFGGVQLIALGVIGEYLGRTFNEAKRRPLYWVQGHDPSEAASRAADRERVADTASIGTFDRESGGRGARRDLDGRD